MLSIAGQRDLMQVWIALWLSGCPSDSVHLEPALIMTLLRRDLSRQASITATPEMWLRMAGCPSCLLRMLARGTYLRLMHLETVHMHGEF